MGKNRHHFHPQFYLKGFIDPGNHPYIWVYDKRDRTIRESAPTDIAVHKHYFRFIDRTGRKDSSLEDVMMQEEDKQAPALARILNGERWEDDRHQIIAFIAFLLVRSPNFRKSMAVFDAALIKHRHKTIAANKEAFDSLITRYEARMGHPLSIPREQLRDFYLRGEYDVKPSPGTGTDLGLALSCFKAVADILFQMRWKLLITTGSDTFVSCDNPVFYYDPSQPRGGFYGVGLLNEHVEVTVPLSSKMAAVASWHLVPQEGCYPVDSETVRKTNLRTIRSAERFVYASTKSEEIKRVVTAYVGSAPTIAVH